MTEYKLKKGNFRSSGLHIGLHIGTTEETYKVKFSKECLYTPIDWENDWNKLCGWSYGMHHKNSIRVCWRPQMVDGLDFNNQLTGNIELCIYVYENSVRLISEKTLVVGAEKEYEFTLKHNIFDNSIVLNFPQLGNGTSMRYTTKPSWGYRLFPYFGGNNPAPHDMSIELERL